MFLYLLVHINTCYKVLIILLLDFIQRLLVFLRFDAFVDLDVVGLVEYECVEVGLLLESVGPVGVVEEEGVVGFGHEDFAAFETADVDAAFGVLNYDFVVDVDEFLVGGCVEFLGSEGFEDAEGMRLFESETRLHINKSP